MNTLKVGFAKVNINPMLGIGVYGYYVPRYASGFLDDLEASALALSCGDKPVLIINVDNCGIKTDVVKRYLTAISKASGILAENIFISCKL